MQLSLKRMTLKWLLSILGIRQGGGVSDLAFEAIVKKQIALMRDPCLLCITLVVEELMNIVHIVTQKAEWPNMAIL